MKFYDGATGQILDSELDKEAVQERLGQPHRLCKLERKGLDVLLSHQKMPQFGDARRNRTVMNIERRVQREKEEGTRELARLEAATEGEQEEAEAPAAAEQI